MNRREIIARTYDLLQAPLSEAGFVLWYVDWYKGSTGMELLVEIDSPKSIDMDECSRANDIINTLLDESDFIPDSYTLEVSSAGLTRDLKNEFQLRYYLGTDTPVTVGLYAPLDGRKQLIGQLVDLDERTIALDCNGEMLNLPRKQISSIKVEL